jgi:hypothetical protein
MKKDETESGDRIPENSGLTLKVTFHYRPIRVVDSIQVTIVVPKSIG